MTDYDYKKVISLFEIDEGLEERLAKRIIKSTNEASNKKLIMLKVLIPITIILICIFGFLNSSIIQKDTIDTNIIESTSSEKEVNTTTQGPINGDTMIFTLTVYPLGPNTNGTFLKPEIEILLPMYSPTMNSVPGLPFYFQFHDKLGVLLADQIELSVDNGNLKKWDQSTGIVDNFGKTVTIDYPSKIYWSPIEYEDQPSITDNATIIVTTKKNGKKIDSQTITIKQLDQIGTYSASISEPIN